MSNKTEKWECPDCGALYSDAQFFENMIVLPRHPGELVRCYQCGKTVAALLPVARRKGEKVEG